MNNTYLAHHGVIGQKWGVRRYQNPDGSLTPAGKEHYGGKNYTKTLKKAARNRKNRDLDIAATVVNGAASAGLIANGLNAAAIGAASINTAMGILAGELLIPIAAIAGAAAIGRTIMDKHYMNVIKQVNVSQLEEAMAEEEKRNLGRS